MFSLPVPRPLRVPSTQFPHRNILSDQSGSTRGEWFVVGAGARLVGIDFLDAAPHTSNVVARAAPLRARDTSTASADQLHYRAWSDIIPSRPSVTIELVTSYIHIHIYTFTRADERTHAHRHTYTHHVHKHTRA